MDPKSSVTIQPAKNISGSVTLPGDKSISHRYAMLAAIAQGTTRLENYSTGKDCASTLECLKSLGCKWHRSEADSNTIEITGSGPVLREPTRALDCGNSGSTMRMLSGVLAGQDFESELVGDESLSRRPMARVVKPLSEMGAHVATAADNRPPLRIRGSKLKAIDYTLPVATAQVKTAILFAGLFADGETSVHEPARTRDHGELALRAFGANVYSAGSTSRIKGGQTLRAIEARVPGDLSSAAFFLCAAALFPESSLVINGLLLNPTRARLLDVLTMMGLQVSVTQIEEHYGELVGSVQVKGGALKGTLIQGADTAALIDEIPVLAAIAPFTSDGIDIRDARELRVKESDRIAAIAQNLRVMGAEVDEREDGLKIFGNQSLHGAELDSHGDHRIAMAFSVAALRATGPTLIQGASAADISYPGYFSTLHRLTER